MSGGEIIVILIVVLLLFGSKKLPDLAQTLGRGMREFQKAKDEIQSELSRSVSEVRDGMGDSVQTIQSDVEMIKNKIAEEMNASDTGNASTEPSDGGKTKNGDAGSAFLGEGI